MQIETRMSCMLYRMAETWVSCMLYPKAETRVSCMLYPKAETRVSCMLYPKAEAMQRRDGEQHNVVIPTARGCDNLVKSCAYTTVAALAHVMVWHTILYYGRIP